MLSVSTVLLIEEIPKKPPRMYKNPVNNGGIYHINWLAGFLPSTIWPHNLWKRHFSHRCPVHPWAKAVGLDVGRHQTSAWWTSDLNTLTLSVYICYIIYILYTFGQLQVRMLVFLNMPMHGPFGPLISQVSPARALPAMSYSHFSWMAEDAV